MRIAIRAIIGWLFMVFSGVAFLGAAPQFPGQLPFKVYGPSEGLPSAPIHCMTQDRDGLIWLGTENGLFRFDGHATKRWSMAEGLPSAWVISLAPLPEGGLWVGTNQGLVLYKEGRIKPVLLNGAPINDSVYSLASDSQGRIWGITRAFPFRMQGPETAVAVKDWPKGRTNMVVPGLTPGTVWILQGHQAIQLKADGTHHAVDAPKDIKGPLESVGEDGAGRLWMAAGRKLFVLEPGASAFKDRSAWMPGGMLQLPATFKDEKGDLWLPTTKGFLILERRGGHRLLGPAQGLPLTWTRCAFTDREGNLWLVGSNLVKLQGKGFLTVHQEHMGLPNGLVWSLLRTRFGEFFAGTSDGLGKLGPTGWKTLPGTVGMECFALVEDKAGRCLLACPTKGLFQIQDAAPPKAIPMPAGTVRLNSVGKDNEERIWLGTSTLGAVPVDPKEAGLAMHPADWKLETINVIAFASDTSGRLWAATLEGLFCREAGRWQRFTHLDGLQADNLLGVSAAPDGGIWVWYDDPRGANKYRRTPTGLALERTLGPGAGLETDMVYFVEETREKLVWVSTELGVYALKGGEAHRFGQGFGLPAEDCVANGALLDVDGSFWVGTLKGLARITPAAAAQPPLVPHARILDAEWADQIHPLPVGSETGQADAKGTFEFWFAAPNFTDEDSLRYQTRVLGLEDKWRDTTVRQARYAGLPGGTYRFEVRAAQGSRPFGPPEGLDFRVRPPWWRTPLARVGYGLMLVLITYGALRMRLASLARSKALLEDTVALRTRELAEANASLETLNGKNLDLIEDLTKALAEVRTIQGLIPICSYCKKIRDDGGAWNQLEMYISSRSKAKFSHGICPECLPRVRAELIKDGMLPPDKQA
ncbi:MAG TPA: two-component regulator propeller domain-containing protein [Geothrix sp.]|nr:two-component regulator propeller domain-containing protein [Geothrix sp.]